MLGSISWLEEIKKIKIKILKEDRFIKKKKEIKTGRVCGRAVNTSNYGAGGSPVALIL